MLTLFYHIAFLIVSIYVLIKSISYGIYEINNEKNTFGGHLVIWTTVFIVIFDNIVVWQNWHIGDTWHIGDVSFCVIWLIWDVALLISFLTRFAWTTEKSFCIICPFLVNFFHLVSFALKPDNFLCFGDTI